MPHFATRDLAAVAVSGAFWAVVNILISPIFWQLTHMPFLCDLLAFLSLTLVVWWTRRFGAASMTGLVVTALTLVLRPGAFQMFGFMAASVVFDVLVRIVGYGNCLEKALRGAVCLILFSVLSAGVAGAIVGAFFMGFNTLPAILTFAVLHGIGGLIGGTLGVVLVRGLMARRITPNICKGA
jgi:hypothetical protein